MDNSENELTREFKLEKLGLNLTNSKSQISDDILNELYNKFIEINKPSSKYRIKQSKCDKVDKEDEKYIVTLKFLNAILITLGKDQIKEITQFKNIRREELLKEECKAILPEYLDKLIELFGKTKLRYRDKNITNQYILMVLKLLVINCGYSFKAIDKKKLIFSSIKKKYERENYVVYEICE